MASSTVTLKLGADSANFSSADKRLTCQNASCEKSKYDKYD